MSVIVAPSLLSADFSDITGALGVIERAGADWLHLDIMDGVFVPAITFGAKLVSDMRPKTTLPFDVHLMTCEPEHHIEAFARAGAAYITFHLEAAVHSHAVCQAIRALGVKAGVSIVPSTPAALLDALLPAVDLILVMTVNPGRGGQHIISSCLDKVSALAARRAEKGYQYRISVDGGINDSTALAAREAGADILVTGSAFFNAGDKARFVRDCRGSP